MRALGLIAVGLIVGCGGELNVGQDGTGGVAAGEASSSGGTSTGNSGGVSTMSSGGASGYFSMGAYSGIDGTGAYSGDFGMGARGGVDGTGAYSGDFGMGNRSSTGGFGTGAYSGDFSMGAYSGSTDPGTGGAGAVGGTTMSTGASSGFVSTGGIPNGGPPTTELPNWPNSDDVTDQPEITGVWEGYTEDELFRPIDKYRLEIAGVTDKGVIRGSVRFGTADPIPAASDPDGEYPPDAVSRMKVTLNQLLDGATYAIVDGAERGQQLRFKIAANEVMRSWCALQTPHMLPSGYFGCLAGDSWGIDRGTCNVLDNTSKVVDSTTPAKCNQCMLCACVAERCDAQQPIQQLFDLTLNSAGELVGTFGNNAIRLTQVM